MIKSGNYLSWEFKLDHPSIIPVRRQTVIQEDNQKVASFFGYEMYVLPSRATFQALEILSYEIDIPPNIKL